MDQQQNLSKTERGVIAFSNIEDFYNELMERVYKILDNRILKKSFTIIMNTRPRNHTSGSIKKEKRFGDFQLIYAGVDRQKVFLEMQKPKGYKTPKEVLDTWKILYESSKSNVLDTENARVSSALQNQFQKFSLNTIQKDGIGELHNYFFTPKGEPTTGRFRNEEYIILKEYLEQINAFSYISLPLIQFAEFDGIVHIIYHKSEKKQFFKKSLFSRYKFIDKTTVGNLIIDISRTYEDLILDWEIDKSEPTEFRMDFFKDLLGEAGTLYQILQDTPLFQELGYREYYRKFKDYLFNRIARANKLPIKVIYQYRQIAIMSILIDSYTHNISAHSLVALEGWFHQRAIRFGHLDGELKTKTPQNLPILMLRESFDLEVQKIFNFLLDKGAFWTGLTRDQSFGGEVISMFKILWDYFITNPLYLGTIAYTEEILRLNIFITILDQISIEEEGLMYRKKVLLNEHFVSIDLTQYAHSEMMKKEGISGFIQKGVRFEEVKMALEKCNAFLPGGVVGRHAFLTIIENEIRNVKHFSPEARALMKKEGLTLNIAVEEAYIHREISAQGKTNECYGVGVWLKHPSVVTQDLIERRLQRLWKDIIVPGSYQPLLGGTSQDKVCAAMLLNNSFGSVQKEASERSERDNQFYPWIKAGFSELDELQEGETVTEWHFSARRTLDGNPDAFDSSKSHPIFQKLFVKPRVGYYKKHFHLWKGANVYEVDPNIAIGKEWENPARFKFLLLQNIDETIFTTQYNELKSLGLIRILDRPAQSLEEAYRNWFPIWIKQEYQSELVYSFIVDAGIVSELHWNGKQVVYRTKDLVSKEYIKTGNKNLVEIDLAHGTHKASVEVKEFRYRSHGILKQYFWQNQEPKSAVMTEALAAELLETLTTKVCIFDNRVNKWVEQMPEEKMYKLGCVIKKEEQSDWEKIRDQGDGFLGFHFVVVHLSFIEAFKKDNIQLYSEDNIDLFFEEQILKGRSLEHCPKNFMLVITSGRGRVQWFTSLEKKAQKQQIDLRPFVTFRPMESLVDAVEKAMVKMDDFELKYSLTKILFGS